MLETSAELLKIFKRSRKEITVKIKSLLRLQEELDAVEDILGSAVAFYRVSVEKSPVPITRDIIEPSHLGVYFTWLKDLPITASSNLLRRKLTESASELSALQKEKLRLDKCQGANTKFLAVRELSALPRIEEGRPSNPRTRFKKVYWDKRNGMFKLTEEFTDNGYDKLLTSKIKSSTRDSRFIEIKSVRDKESQFGRSTKVKSKKGHSAWKLIHGTIFKTVPLLIEDPSDLKNEDCDNMYSDLIDLDKMEKLDSIDVKQRRVYTAKCYGELFDENSSLLPAKNKVRSNKEENKDCSDTEQLLVSGSKVSRTHRRNYDIFTKPSLKLARLFIGKKKDRSKLYRTMQLQKTVQSQEQCVDNTKGSRRMGFATDTGKLAITGNFTGRGGRRHTLPIFGRVIGLEGKDANSESLNQQEIRFRN